MIYQETLRMLKKAAADPYTIDEPKGYSPSAIATRFWLNNDPKIVDQRNRLNKIKASDDQARNMGAKVRSNINDLVYDSVGRVVHNNGQLSPRQAYNLVNNYRNLYRNDFDRRARGAYHIDRAAAEVGGTAGMPYPSNMRKMTLMRQNPRHGLNYFNTVDNIPVRQTDVDWLGKVTK